MTIAATATAVEAATTTAAKIAPNRRAPVISSIYISLMKDRMESQAGLRPIDCPSALIGHWRFGLNHLPTSVPRQLFELSRQRCDVRCVDDEQPDSAPSWLFRACFVTKMGQLGTVSLTASSREFVTRATLEVFTWEASACKTASYFGREQTLRSNGVIIVDLRAADTFRCYRGFSSNGVFPEYGGGRSERQRPICMSGPSHQGARGPFDLVCGGAL